MSSGIFEDPLDEVVEHPAEQAERERRQEAMRNTFERTDSGKQVLSYLKRFCYYDQKFENVADSHGDLAYAAGRRDVFVEIMRYLTLDDIELLQIQLRQLEEKNAA